MTNTYDVHAQNLELQNQIDDLRNDIGLVAALCNTLYRLEERRSRNFVKLKEGETRFDDIYKNLETIFNKADKE